MSLNPYEEYELTGVLEAPRYCFCDWCGEEILIGEDYYEIGDDRVCENCIENCKRSADRW